MYRKISQTPSFDFLANFKLNEEALIYLSNLKYKYKLFIFTSETIQNAPEIKDKIEAVFDKIYSAEQMMLDKTDPEAYRKLSNAMGFEEQEILFVDDSPVNVRAAGDAGMVTFQYKDNESLMIFIGGLE